MLQAPPGYIEQYGGHNLDPQVRNNAIRTQEHKAQFLGDANNKKFGLNNRAQRQALH